MGIRVRKLTIPGLEAVVLCAWVADKHVLEFQVRISCLVGDDFDVFRGCLAKPSMLVFSQNLGRLGCLFEKHLAEIQLTKDMTYLQELAPLIEYLLDHGIDFWVQECSMPRWSRHGVVEDF
jgi:hypothetical protein